MDLCKMINMDIYNNQHHNILIWFVHMNLAQQGAQQMYLFDVGNLHSQCTEWSAIDCEANTSHENHGRFECVFWCNCMYYVTHTHKKKCALKGLASRHTYPVLLLANRVEPRDVVPILYPKRYWTSRQNIYSTRYSLQLQSSIDLPAASKWGM